ncbi:MAG: serine/threonine-protein kinase, partial [Planctomycetota bacterium]
MEIDPEARTRITEAKPDPFVGRTIDGFRIDSLIGRGGMGTVYRATQLSLNRPVALKILPESLLDAHFRERFHREAEVLSRLTHPNIVTVFDRGEVDGRPYLVMEYVEGTNLRTVLREGPLPQAEALQILSSVLAALDYAHRNGIVHRDVKPENILLTRSSVPKVADFGLSRILGPEERTRLTRTHLMLGTYEYMAPEQREHARDADERSDLYAAGVVLYEMLLRELPIGRFELPSRKRPGECDRRLDAILERSLNKDPDERYQRASEMADAVSAVLERPEPRPAPDLAADLAPGPAAPREESTPSGAYAPLRLETHLDNIATINQALGTICYVAGFLVLFSIFRLTWGGFFLFFIAGWYLRETAEQLRKYRPAARSAQAVLAVGCC